MEDLTGGERRSVGSVHPHPSRSGLALFAGDGLGVEVLELTGLDARALDELVDLAGPQPDDPAEAVRRQVALVYESVERAGGDAEPSSRLLGGQPVGVGTGTRSAAEAWAFNHEIVRVDVVGIHGDQVTASLCFDRLSVQFLPKARAPVSRVTPPKGDKQRVLLSYSGGSMPPRSNAQQFQQLRQLQRLRRLRHVTQSGARRERGVPVELNALVRDALRKDVRRG